MNSADQIAILLDYGWPDTAVEWHAATQRLVSNGAVYFNRSQLVQCEDAISVPAVDPVGLSNDDAAPQPKRKRKPSMADAAREGVEIKIAPDGTVTMAPVKPVDATLIDDDTTIKIASEWN